LLYRVSTLLYRVSTLLYRVSTLLYRVSTLLYRVSTLLYRVSTLLYRVSMLLYFLQQATLNPKNGAIGSLNFHSYNSVIAYRIASDNNYAFVSTSNGGETLTQERILMVLAHELGHLMGARHDEAQMEGHPCAISGENLKIFKIS